MRLSLLIPVSLVCLFLLTACPFSTTIPLSVMGEEQIDKKLLGNWVCKSKDGAVKKINFSEGNEEGTYDVWVEKPGKIYIAGTIQFTAWVTRLGGVNFLTFQEVQSGDPQEIYYAYAYRFYQDMVYTYVLGYDKVDMTTITTTDQYREAVTAAVDEGDALFGEETWKRKD